jgi:hypothetical protein
MIEADPATRDDVHSAGESSGAASDSVGDVATAVADAPATATADQVTEAGEAEETLEAPGGVQVGGAEMFHVEHSAPTPPIRDGSS